MISSNSPIIRTPACVIPASETPRELLPYASNNSNRHNITIERTQLQLGLQLDQHQMRAWHLPTSTVFHFPKKWVCLTSRWAFNWPQCSKQKEDMVERVVLGSIEFGGFPSNTLICQNSEHVPRQEWIYEYNNVGKFPRLNRMSKYGAQLAGLPHH